MRPVMGEPYPGGPLSTERSHFVAVYPASLFVLNLPFLGAFHISHGCPSMGPNSSRAGSGTGTSACTPSASACTGSRAETLNGG